MDLEKTTQPLFTVKNMGEYYPRYRKSGEITWKDGRKRSRSKVYPLIHMDKVQVNPDFQVNTDILEQSREQYAKSGQLIPVLLSPDNFLLNGYEQYVLAREQGNNMLAFYPLKLTKTEKRVRKENKAVKRRRITKAERIAVFEKCKGRCSRCNKVLQNDDPSAKDTYMTVDHKKRLSQGGANSLRNLQGLCRYCHGMKDNQGKLIRKKKGKHKRALPTVGR